MQILKNKNGNTEIIVSGKWKNLHNQYVQKLEVDGTAYKYRIYYKTTWNNVEKPKLLTFIMLNPSTANQYSNDQTVNNCIKVAKKSNYDGIEILNIYSLRHPAFAEIKDILLTEGNPKGINYDMAQFENVVLAWGNKKVSPKNNPTLFEKLNKAKKIFILGVEDYSKIKIGYKYNPSQIRHPGTMAWTRLGGIDNAKLINVSVFNLLPLKQLIHTI